MITLRSRYTNLYIPSDFFNSNFSWLEAFPLHRPFQLGHHSSFHVMSKEVQGVDKMEATLEPSDADHLYSAKVSQFPWSCLKVMKYASLMRNSFCWYEEWFFCWIKSHFTCSESDCWLVPNWDMMVSFGCSRFFCYVSAITYV